MNKREATQLVKSLLDVGEQMLGSGAEVWRAEDSMLRMLRSYGFKDVNVWLIASNIQVSVETDEGEIITQIRYVKLGESNFDRLDYLNNLSRTICANLPDSNEINNLLHEVINRPRQPRWLHYLGGILGGTGFAVFFNCGPVDAAIAVVASIIIIALGEVLEKREHNPFRFNAIISFIVEIFILLVVVVFGIGESYNNITLGVVMLMISGLGFTNGIRSFLNIDVLSGFIILMNAFMGACGIAIGIALPILMMKGVL